MSTGPKYKYLYADGTNVKQQLKVTTREYIEYLMIWVENQLNIENIFPSFIGISFPKIFFKLLKLYLETF